jgi:hypothetical protein
MNVEELNKSQNVIDKNQLKNILGGKLGCEQLMRSAAADCGFSCESCDDGCKGGCHGGCTGGNK